MLGSFSGRGVSAPRAYALDYKIIFKHIQEVKNR
jgi:hypothetical protein